MKEIIDALWDDPEFVTTIKARPWELLVLALQNGGEKLLSKLLPNIPLCNEMISAALYNQNTTDELATDYLYEAIKKSRNRKFHVSFAARIWKTASIRVLEQLSTEPGLLEPIANNPNTPIAVLKALLNRHKNLIIQNPWFFIECIAVPSLRRGAIDQKAFERYMSLVIQHIWNSSGKDHITRSFADYLRGKQENGSAEAVEILWKRFKSDQFAEACIRCRWFSEISAKTIESLFKRAKRVWGLSWRVPMILGFKHCPKNIAIEAYAHYHRNEREHIRLDSEGFPRETIEARLKIILGKDDSNRLKKTILAAAELAE